MLLSTNHDSYRLGPVLGSGGMGVVYEGVGANGSVAIKILHAAQASDPYALARFHDEVIAGSIVQHPRLVTVIDRGELEDGRPFLVMPRVSGESLATILDREGLPAVAQAIGLVGQLLDGLGALHDAGIVHGDVKTDNILVDHGRGAITLVDFGLAHAWFSRETRHEPPADLISGTPAYMAPEVIRGEPRTAASDQYGAGVILYELITGAPPFTGRTVTQVFERHLNDDVVPPSLVAPERDIPPILERIVMRALAKDPEQRFPSVAAFAKALSIARPCLSERRQPPRAPRRRTGPTLEWRSIDTAARGGIPNDTRVRPRFADGTENPRSRS